MVKFLKWSMILVWIIDILGIASTMNGGIDPLDVILPINTMFWFLAIMFGLLGTGTTE